MRPSSCADQPLGRRAHQRRAVAGVEEEHVRGGIHDAERAIDGEGVEPRHGRREPLREDDLDRCHRLGCAPGRARRPRSRPPASSSTGARARSRTAGGSAGRGARSRSRTWSIRSWARAGRGVGPAVLVEERAGDDPHGVAPMVERDDGVHEGQAEDGQPEIVGRAIRQPLPQAHRIVGEVPEEAAGERGQLGIARGAVAAKIPRDGLEGPPSLDHGPVGSEDAHLHPVALEHQPGIPAEDREARHLLRPLDALQKEARREVPEAQVGGDRGLEVGEELSRDGQDVGRPAPPGPAARDGYQRRLGTARHRRLLSLASGATRRSQKPKKPGSRGPSRSARLRLASLLRPGIATRVQVPPGQRGATNATTTSVVRRADPRAALVGASWPAR